MQIWSHEYGLQQEGHTDSLQRMRIIHPFGLRNFPDIRISGQSELTNSTEPSDNVVERS
jgi:hypothetical protein